MLVPEGQLIVWRHTTSGITAHYVKWNKKSSQQTSERLMKAQLLNRVNRWKMSRPLLEIKDPAQRIVTALSGFLDLKMEGISTATSEALLIKAANAGHHVLLSCKSEHLSLHRQIHIDELKEPLMVVDIAAHVACRVRFVQGEQHQLSSSLLDLLPLDIISSIAETLDVKTLVEMLKTSSGIGSWLLDPQCTNPVSKRIWSSASKQLGIPGDGTLGLLIEQAERRRNRLIGTQYDAAFRRFSFIPRRDQWVLPRYLTPPTMPRPPIGAEIFWLPWM